MLHFRKQGAFTLIELLIVVAIIAILAAIAVPNFLEAQTRAKVSRAKSDMRTLATALESYYVDNNNYAPSAPVDAENGPNAAFGSNSVIDPIVMDAIQWWISRPGGTSWGSRDDQNPMRDYINHTSTDKEDVFKAFQTDPTQADHERRRPVNWGGGAWYSSNVITIPVGGSGFVALSTPISYISNPTLSDPWMSGHGGSASFVKYVACNKFMPIGFTGGAESYVTSRTSGDMVLWDQSGYENPVSGDVAPANTGGGDPAFDANEDSQILWWALYVVGPDKTDSVVVENPDGGGEIRMSMMDMWASSWDTDDAHSGKEGPYLLDDGEIAAIVGAHVYDPTNGTKSGGEIWRLGGGRPADKTTNSEGDIMIDSGDSGGDDNEAYSVTSQVYKNLSAMVK